jgi:hypothetical protein
LAGETNRSSRRENLPQRHFLPSQNPTWPDPGLKPGRRGGKPATNRPDRLWGPPNLLSNGYRGVGGYFPGGKAAEPEANHSPPASAEVKKMWIYTSTPPYAFMAKCLIS